MSEEKNFDSILPEKGKSSRRSGRGSLLALRKNVLEEILFVWVPKLRLQAYPSAQEG